MRRTASEIINDLESRIARLEKKSYDYDYDDEIDFALGELASEEVLVAVCPGDSSYDDVVVVKNFTVRGGELVTEKPTRADVAKFVQGPLASFSRGSSKMKGATFVGEFQSRSSVARGVRKVYVGVVGKTSLRLDAVDLSTLLSKGGMPSSSSERAVQRFGSTLVAMINKDLSRTASTSKVAGHIVLAGAVNVRDLKRDLEDTFGVEDVELEDGVLTFLMDKFDNKSVEKDVKDVARSHGVKFEKGELTDGLGMIYTKKASLRRRRF